jgi:hypothetical protein
LLLPNRPRWEAQPGTLRLTFAPRAAAFAWIALAIYLGVLLSVLTGADSLVPTHHTDKYFVICNVLAGIGIFASILAVISAARAWWRKGLRPISQIKFSLVALASIFLVWFSIHWNLIGPAHRF